MYCLLWKSQQMRAKKLKKKHRRRRRRDKLEPNRHLKAEKFCLKTYVKIYIVKKIYKNTYNII